MMVLTKKFATTARLLKQHRPLLHVCVAIRDALAQQLRREAGVTELQRRRIVVSATTTFGCAAAASQPARVKNARRAIPGDLKHGILIARRQHDKTAVYRLLRRARTPALHHWP